MIVMFILSFIVAVIKLILSLILIPAAPLVFLNAINNIVPFFAFPIVVLRNYIGDTFFITMLVMIVTSITVFIGIRPAIWFYNKIRGSGGGS